MQAAMRHIGVIVLCLMSAAGAASEQISDAQIRNLIVEQSMRSYPGNCPCPFNVDRAGRRCGARSAYNRAGGYAPVCFAREISDEQVRLYRATQRKLGG
jgi:hypothetical protein